MPTYAIGDIQGCFEPLQALLRAIHFNPQADTLWCTGDLVNRGPQSLEVLRFFKSLGERHVVVLGNHDLHLIAVKYGVRPSHAKDTLQPILAAPDCDELIEWLCQRPMLAYHPTLQYVMTHAGLAPQWSLATAQTLAKEIEATLQKPALRVAALRELFGNTGDQWDDHLEGYTRLRVATNYFTRMRFCYPDGRLFFAYKGSVSQKPQGVIPWFEVMPQNHASLKIIFGHWAALEGKTTRANLFPLDTGCVWGNSLTAMRLEDGEPFSVGCGA